MVTEFTKVTKNTDGSDSGKKDEQLLLRSHEFLSVSKVRSAV